MKLLEQIALDNKYTRWYCSIIEKALIRSNNRKDAKELLGYVEGHHIVPRCFKTDNSDIAYLTAKEHFVVHHLLCKMFDDKRKQFQMVCAFMKMSRPGYLKDRMQVSAKFYETSKRYLSKVMSERIVSEETREKSRMANKGQIPWNKGKTGMDSEETKKKRKESINEAIVRLGGKLSSGNTGHRHSEESKRKMSKNRKDKYSAWNKGMKNPQIIGAETRKKLSESAKKDWQKRKQNLIEGELNT